MSFSDDYDIDDIVCPNCRTQLHSRDCSQIGCNDGFIDAHNDDPLNYSPGESYEKCGECHGTGIERWCPNCGWQWRGESLKKFYIY